MENTTPKTAEEMLSEYIDSNDPTFWKLYAMQMERFAKAYARQEQRRIALQVRAECAEKAKAVNNGRQNLGTYADHDKSGNFLGYKVLESEPLVSVDKDSILSINVDQFIR